MGVGQIVGISTDSPFSHRAYAERLGLDYALLSDYNLGAARAFGVLRDELFGFQPLNTRAVFLVDLGGVLLLHIGGHQVAEAGGVVRLLLVIDVDGTAVDDQSGRDEMIDERSLAGAITPDTYRPGF